MSQPKTTSQKPKPLSAAEKNLSLCRYLPRSTPSMSDTATLTRLPDDSRTASSTSLGAMSCGIGGILRVCWRDYSDDQSLDCTAGTVTRTRRPPKFCSASCELTCMAHAV